MSPELRWTLQIASGVFWTLTYLLIIKRGFRDKALGMPLTALCANISWEFIFSFIHPHGLPQIYVNYVWFVFDGIIVVQAVKFGARDFSKSVSVKLFYPFFALTLLLSFCAYLPIACHNYLEMSSFEVRMLTLKAFANSSPGFALKPWG